MLWRFTKTLLNPACGWSWWTICAGHRRYRWSAAKLVEQVGAEISGFAFLIELEALKEGKTWKDTISLHWSNTTSERLEGETLNLESLTECIENTIQMPTLISLQKHISLPRQLMKDSFVIQASLFPAPL